jgi:hypothetical protein
VLIAESRTFKVGRYTIRQQPRFDNPAFGKYLIFRGDDLIGSTFSVPDAACCEWLEAQLRAERTLAKQHKAEISAGRRGKNGTRAGYSELDHRASLTVKVAEDN